jgi:hypothetical protein
MRSNLDILVAESDAILSLNGSDDDHENTHKSSIGLTKELKMEEFPRERKSKIIQISLGSRSTIV